MVEDIQKYSVGNMDVIYTKVKVQTEYNELF